MIEALQTMRWFCIVAALANTYLALVTAPSTASSVVAGVVVVISVASFVYFSRRLRQLR